MNVPDPGRPEAAPSAPQPARSFRFAVNVTPKPGILDPQGRAVEGSLPHLGIAGVHDVRVGRRVELSVDAADETAASAIVSRLATDLLSNPLIEAFAVELLGAASSTTSSPTTATPGDGVPAGGVPAGGGPAGDSAAGGSGA